MANALHNDEISLSGRELAFAAAYIELGPIKKRIECAGLKAGFSPRSARQSGARMLQKATVSAWVRAREEELANAVKKRGLVTREWVIAHLLKIVEHCMEQRPVMLRTPMGDIETGYSRMNNPIGAIKALYMLGKHIGMFQPKKPDDLAGFSLTINLGLDVCPYCGAALDEKKTC